MFRSFLTTFFRNTTKHIVYVLINVIGLGLALSVCIVAYLNYKFDRDFDKDQVNRDLIFRIEHTQLIEGTEKYFASTPVHLGPVAVREISGIGKMTRITRDLVGTLVKAGENEKYAGLIYADPDLFGMFTFPLISGSFEPFSDNHSIVITEQLATFLFGDQNPLGEAVDVWGSPYTVAAVIKNHPLNSSFRFEAVVPIRDLFATNHVDDTSWGNIYAASTFILVTDRQQAGIIERSLQQYVPAVNKANFHQVARFYLAPFKEMAHRARAVNGSPFRPSLHPAAVLPPAIAALCILLIACFNFTGTSITFAGQRLKEIGIRKVAGGHRIQLIWQFTGENLLLILFAFIFALFFARYLVPAYSNMWDFIDLSYSLSKDPELWGFILMSLIAVSLLSTAYPALYISSFRPVTILQDRLRLGGSGLLPRVILGIQIGISALALFTAVVFLQNAAFQDKFDPGFDGASLTQVDGDDKDIKVFRDAIQNHPDITGISRSILGPFFNSRSVKYNETVIEAKMRFLDLDAFKTMGLQLIEGRPFEEGTSATDRLQSILVNRELVEELQIPDPVGKMIIMADTVPLSIIGVIENVLDDGTMTTVIQPVFYRLAGDRDRTGGLYIRTDPGKRERVLQYLEKEWARVLPDVPFRWIEGNVYSLVSEFIVRNILKISISLVLIAFLLSSAGLYSQLSLRILQRTREIGIRKALGATVSQVILFINHEFLLVLMIGSIAGEVTGYFLNHALLDSIWNYYPNMSILTFLAPVLVIFTFSALLVSSRVYMAASGSPAPALKHE